MPRSGHLAISMGSQHTNFAHVFTNIIIVTIITLHARDEIARSSLKILSREPEFDELSDKTRIDILLDKATRYEQQLDDLRAVVFGERPEQMRFRSGGTLCTFNCSDKTFADGPHNAGTEHACRSCAVYMTKLVADRLSITEH